MTKPVVFIDALPPDAPRSTHEIQKSKVRRAAAHHAHDARRLRSIAYEENKQHAARQAGGRLQQIRPRQVNDQTRPLQESYREKPPNEINDASGNERQDECSTVTDNESTSSGLHARSIKLYHLQKQASMPVRRAASRADNSSTPITFDKAIQSETTGSVARLSPSLFFSRWTADLEACSSKLESNTISSTLEAIDCFVNAVLPNNAPLYGMFEVSNHLVLPIMDELITDRSFREIWSSSMHNCRSVLAPSSKSPRSALVHKVEGMALLRQDMEDSAFESNDYKLAAVACLAYMSSWDGDTSVSDMHFNYLLRAIENRGGLDVLGFDGWLKSTILQLDSLLALQTGISRFQAYRVQRIPRYDMDFSEISMLRYLDTLPNGFCTLARQGLLSFETIEVLVRVNGLGSQVDPLMLKPDVTGRWRSGKHQDFYSAFPCFAIPGVNLEKLLCATLILYSVNQFSPQSDGKDIITAFVVPQRFVTEHLLEVVLVNEAERECLLWIYAVLIDSYRTPRPDLLAQCNLQLPGWQQDFHKIMNKFFWSPRFAASCQNKLGI